MTKTKNDLAKNVEMDINPIVKDTVDHPASNDVINSVETENVQKPITYGVVFNCFRLRIRKEGNLNGEIICEVESGTKLAVYESQSNNDFYKVCTASGISGYCMKKYVSIN